MKQILFALLFSLATTAVFAQSGTARKPATSQATPKTLEQRADEMTASMAKHLRLTPEQSEKIKAINLTNMQHAEAAKASYKKDPQRLAQIMDIISQTRLSQIKDVLSPQQFAQYQARREEKMGVPSEARSAPGSKQQESSLQNQY